MSWKLHQYLGPVAEWLRRGLQILAPRFDSGRGLHFSLFILVLSRCWRLAYEHGLVQSVLTMFIEMLATSMNLMLPKHLPVNQLLTFS